MPRSLNKRRKWIDKTDEELIQMLKTELIRIGLQDNPRRVPVQAKYDNKNMPSPFYYETRFNMKWPELVETIGMPLTHLPRKGARLKHAHWLEKSDEDLLQHLKDEILRLDFQEYPSVHKVNQRYDRNNMPPPRLYLRHFGISWKAILDRTGVAFERETLKYTPHKWLDVTDEEFLRLLKTELERIDILDNPSMARFQNEYDNKRVPSASFFLLRFDCGWADLLLKIGIRYGRHKLI